VRDADLATVPVRAASSGKGWHSLVLTHPALSATGMPFCHLWATAGQLLDRKLLDTQRAVPAGPAVEYSK